MLKNAYLDAKIGVDPAENEPRKECWAGVGPRNRAGVSGPRGALRGRQPLAPRRAQHRRPMKANFVKIFVKFLSIFCQISAKSSQIFASKIAFFSIFQNLQDFTKLCKNSAKFLQTFCKLLPFLSNFQKILKILQNSVKFCLISQNLLAKDDFLVELEKC